MQEVGYDRRVLTYPGFCMPKYAQNGKESYISIILENFPALWFKEIVWKNYVYPDFYALKNDA